MKKINVKNKNNIIYKLVKGYRYGRLTVIDEVNIKRPGGKPVRGFKCICDCGKIRNTPVNDLIIGKAKECLVCRVLNMKRNKLVKNRVVSYDNVNSSHELYPIWTLMLDRCYISTSKNYVSYGKRGITVCDRWHSLSNFVKDMHPRLSMKHTLDRIDNDGNYEPTNCKWSTSAEQTRNKRNNRWFVGDGRKKILADWIKEFNVSPATLMEYIDNHGWEKAYEWYSNADRIRGKLISYNGIVKNKRDWASLFGVPVGSISYLIKRHSFKKVYNKYVRGIGYNRENERVTINSLFSSNDLKIMQGDNGSKEANTQKEKKGPI